MLQQLYAQTNFAKYKALFPALSQPFTTIVDSIAPTGATINFDFSDYIPGMQNNSFSRGVNDDYAAIGKIAETPAYVALIYSITQFDYEPDPESAQRENIVNTMLYTYSPTGTIIDYIPISCRCSEDSTTTVKIENNIITTRNYYTIWKYSDAIIDSIQQQNYALEQAQQDYQVRVDSTSAADTVHLKILAALNDSITTALKKVDSLTNLPNSIVKVKLTGKKSYRITDDGKFEELPDPKTALK